MTAPLRDLPAAVLAELAALPGGSGLPGHRAHLMGRNPRFAEVMRRLERAGLPPRALAELWLWLVHLTVLVGSRADTTGHSYARTVGRFLGWAAGRGLDFTAATLEDFDRWQIWLSVHCGNGHAWRGQQVYALRNFYDWRRSRGIAPSNLAAEVVGPRSKAKPARKYTDEQLRALFRAVSEAREPKATRDRSIMLLLLAAGLRREEVATLTLGQIEISRRVGVLRIHGKGAKERDVPIEGPAVEALSAWLMARDALPFTCDSDAVFVSLGTPVPGAALSLNSYDTLLKRYAQRAKLKTWGNHRFRITYATQLYDDGHGIETIRALLGHESIETTRRYLAVSDKARKTRLSADRQHRVLGTKPTGTPMWARAVAGDMARD